MPVKAMAAYERRVNSDSVDYCQVHHEGCKNHRHADPAIWGRKGDKGRWVVTPDEALDHELTFLADQLEMLSGLSRDEFLAKPCKVVQMPRAEYRRKFGRQSTEVDMELVRLLGQGRTTPNVPDTFRPASEGTG